MYQSFVLALKKYFFFWDSSLTLKCVIPMVWHYNFISF